MTIKSHDLHKKTNNLILKIILLLCLIFGSFQIFGQNKIYSIKTVLDSLASTSVPELNNEVDISFSNIAIKELIRTIGNTTGVNITIDPTVTYSVNSNFNKVRAADVIGFLCSRYNLDLVNLGAIIHLQPIIIKEEKLSVEMINDSIISYEAYKIKTADFFKELTDKTGSNFILSPDLGNALINGYAKNIGFKDALIQLSGENKLEIKRKADHLYAVSPALNKGAGEVIDDAKTKKATKFTLKYQEELIDAEIENTPVYNILEELSHQSGYSVCLLSAIDGKASIRTKYTGLPDFMNSLFFGTENTYRISDRTIFIGSRKLPGIKSCEVVKLNNRSVDSLLQALPQQIKQDLSIKEFAEQNSFIIWGDADIISNFTKTLEKIDVVVPVILIDVIIVDAGKNFEIETGLEAGIKDTPTATSGTINPGLDYTMGATSVNNMLSRIGLTNLGKVTPNFYVKLKAMETDGKLEIRSTPQLSTMNGHSAKMSIGQTEYYREEMSNMYGSQNPQLQTQKIFKPVEAKLAVNIKPFVTGNGQVSLTIEVEQSQFTARIDEFAPPGLESRKFSSMIRVRNQEMILLGGLEENTNSSTRNGWPFLSKVPILNWIFSHKTEKNNKSHLNIFIKPTVIY
jgi:type IV pilus assembly protein PilQ